MRVASAESAQTLAVEVGTRQRSIGGWVRMAVETDGETIIRATPLLGHVHRGIEKCAEDCPYAGVPRLLACADHLAVTHTADAFAMALERLAGIRVPQAASWLRASAMEIERAQSHVAWLCAWTWDAGLPRASEVASRVRATIAEALEALTGARSGRGYVVPGGVALQPSTATIGAADALLSAVEPRLEELAATLDRGDVFARFARGVGAVERTVCQESCAAGPCLRASGVALDARHYLPCLPYPQVQIAVPLGTSGDCWDRCFVRLEEARCSIRIARSLLAGVPGGAHAAKVDEDLCPPAGEAYAAVESPRGELGVHIVSDGSARPYRLRLRSPSLLNLGAAAAALEGEPLDAGPFILGSFDLIAAEIER